MKRVSRNGNQCETKIKSLGPGDKTTRQEIKLCRNGECSKIKGREKEENPTPTIAWSSVSQTGVSLGITQKPNKGQETSPAPRSRRGPGPLYFHQVPQAILIGTRA